MKERYLYIVLLLALSLQVVAEVSPCDDFYGAYKEELPDTYCECTYNTFSFAFPVDSVLSEPTWFTATIDDLKQGLSAYWFSSDYVTMDVYAFCVSSVPTFSITIGPNSMYEMDMEKINKKIDEMGSTASFLTALTPHIHVYTRNGGAGHVYCYPYDQGPHSTCENALEMRPGMTYVCSEEENVYRLPYKSISSKGHAFIQWKHKPKKTSQSSQPADLWLTLDSCNGEEAARVTLSDSLHVYQPDSAMLVNARNAERDIWVHVKHAKGVPGRLKYYNNPKYAEPLPAVTQSSCAGKSIVVDNRAYYTDTAFVDTVWLGHDTLRTRQLSLSFTLNTKTDTVRATETEIRRGYVHSSGVVLREFGDTIFDVVKANTCTVRYLVTVLNTTGVETLNGHKGPRKQIRNGQLVILMDDKKYNILGQQLDNQ